MRSSLNDPASADEASNPLEESGYDFAESSDDEHAESIVSVDLQTPDAISIAESEASDDSDIPSYHQDATSTHTAPDTNNEDGADHSWLTAKPPVEDARHSRPHLDDFTHDKPSSLFYPVHRDIDSSSVYHALRSYESAPVTLKGSTLTQSKRMEGPFRILYLGDPGLPPSFARKRDTVEKIAKALFVNQGLGGGYTTSREGSGTYHVYPTSAFGDANSTPEIELVESSGVDIQVDECTSASLPAQGSSKDSYLIDLELNGTKIIRYESLSHEKYKGLWDLAVISHHSTNVDLSIQAIRNMMWECSIPILEVSKSIDREGELEAWPPSNQMYLEFEKRGRFGKRYELKRVPIDLQTLLHIDARELGAHLQFLRYSPWKTASSLPTTPRGIESAANDETGMGFSRKTTKLRSEFAEFGRRMLRKYPIQLTVLATLMTLSLSLHIFSAVSPLQSRPSGDLAVSPTFASPSSTSMAVITPSMDTAVGQSLLNSFAPPVNESGEFRVHKLGEHHIVLTPPKRFTALRKPPKLNVVVTRGPTRLNSRLNKLVDGVYAVELDHDQAHGLLHISIRTGSKPFVELDTDLDFGHPWFNLGSWSHRVNKVSNTTLSGFTRFCSRLNAKKLALGREMQAVDRIILQHMEAFATGPTRLASDALNVVNETTERVRRMVGHRSAKILRARRHVSLRLSSLAKVAVSPRILDRDWRTSAVLRRANRNSKGLWGRITGKRINKTGAVFPATRPEQRCTSKRSRRCRKH